MNPASLVTDLELIQTEAELTITGTDSIPCIDTSRIWGPDLAIDPDLYPTFKFYV